MAERGKIFKDAPIITPSRSWFDMSYENTFSMNIGENVPAAIYECLPGDYIKAKTDSITRFSPMLAPVMTSVNQFSYHFYVRMRDIWTNFDKFITNNDQKATWQQNVSGFTPPTMPYFKIRELLYDPNYLGQFFTARIPTGKYIDFGASGTKCYRLVIQLYLDTHGNLSNIYYFVDKAINPTYNLPYTSGTADTDQIVYWVIDFKPNPSEFDYDFDMGSNGIPNDYYRLNPFGNGSLLDFLGVDCNAIYQTQWKYYNDVITEADTASSHSVWPALFNLDTLNYIFEHGTDSTGAPIPIFDNMVPEGMTVNGGTNPASLSDFQITSLKEFFANHSIESVGVFHHFKNSSSFEFSRAIADGMYSSDSVNPTNSTTVGLSAITEDPLCALPIRAYRFIYDEYFRDQNYIPVNPITDFTRDGDEFAGLVNPTLTDLNNLVDYLSLTRKAWEHDPYTTALPGPQRGDAVRFLADPHITYEVTGAAGSVLSGDTRILGINLGGTNFSSANSAQSGTYRETELTADLSAATIENFRWANAMQKYLEKKARTGGRYYEYLLGIWNKSVDDSKLNRPIYLSGDRTPIQVSEVLQTSQTDVNSRQALGDMAGRAIALGSDDFIEYECPDYGYFIELTTVLPRVAYQSGVSPIFLKESYLDFPLPDFAKLGEEYVKQKELYYLADSSEDNKAFGYQSRYYNYKYRRSEVHSEMKDSLDYWHFGRKFDSAPVNGKLFIECHPDYRQFAVTYKGFNHVYCQMWHDVQMNRALPEYGVPVL